jgi:apolipoprotein D and lipocalin family protein
MRIAIVLAVLSVAMLAACTMKRGPSLPPPDVVPFVDLARYAGTWYEIASYPDRFQKG